MEKTFQFYHYDEPELIYTATKDETSVDDYFVTWENGDSVLYSQQEMERHLEEGIWIEVKVNEVENHG